MRIVNWKFDSLEIVMIEDDQGELYTPSSVLAKALDVTDNDLRYLYNAHKEEYDGLSASRLRAKEFIKLNKHLLGVRRVREDLHLWSESDMILHAMHSRTQQGRKFRKDLIGFIKQHATRSSVYQEQLDVMRTEIEELRRVVEASGEARNRAASLAGAGLQAHRKTKLHLVH